MHRCLGSPAILNPPANHNNAVLDWVSIWPFGSSINSISEVSLVPSGIWSWSQAGSADHRVILQGRATSYFKVDPTSALTTATLSASDSPRHSARQRVRLGVACTEADGRREAAQRIVCAADLSFSYGCDELPASQPHQLGVYRVTQVSSNCRVQTERSQRSNLEVSPIWYANRLSRSTRQRASLLL